MCRLKGFLALFGLMQSLQIATSSTSPRKLNSTSSSSPSPISVNVTDDDPGREARIALINSGPALSYTGLALATVAFSAGVDIELFLKHGQFIAMSANLKGLDVNFTFCQLAKKKSEDQAANAVCPRNQEEKVYTRWSSFFNIYGLNFLIIPSDVKMPEDYPTGIDPVTGYADPFHPGVRISRAWSTLVFFLIVQLVFLGIQVAAYKVTENEEEEYDKAMTEAYDDKSNEKMSTGKAKNFGPTRCGCLNSSWPQNLHPCVPIRYWLNMPYMQIKLLLSFHFSICSMSLLSLVSGSDGIAVGVILLLVAIAVPVMSLVITMKLTNSEGANGSRIMLIKGSTYHNGKAWRDRDLQGRSTSIYPKSWRKSDYTNKFSAPFIHLKEKRKYYTTIRLVLNFVEASIIVGVFTSGRPSTDGFEESRADYTSIAAACFYICDFFFLLLYRPYRRCIKTLMSLLQDFMCFVVVMATALYVTDGIFNTQDLLKIETDGVELMLCIFCSVGCSVWFLILVGETFLVYARVKEQLGSEEIWDKESDDYRRTNLTRGHSVKSALSAMTDRSATALPAMLLHMKKSSTDGNTTDKPQDVEMSETPNPAAEPAQSSAANSEVTVSSTENAHDVTKSAGTSNALPDGWSEIKDPTSGHSYYHHPTKGTQWTRPEPDVSPEVATSLPSDWRELKTEDGRTYFHHRLTNQTSWVLPT